MLLLNRLHLSFFLSIVFSFFYYSLADTSSNAQTLHRLASKRQVKENLNTNLDKDRVVYEGVNYGIETLRFLQLLTEGHFFPLQKAMRSFTGELAGGRFSDEEVDISMVHVCVDYLEALLWSEDLVTKQLQWSLDKGSLPFVTQVRAAEKIVVFFVFYHIYGTFFFYVYTIFTCSVFPLSFLPFIFLAGCLSPARGSK